MARVTDQEVKRIIDTTLTTTAFIKAANLIVTDRLVGEGLSDTLLKEIERWLAAHLVAIRDPNLKEERIGDARNAYNVGKTGLGLQATSYGQQVEILDTTGKLASIGKMAASIELIGEY